MKNMFSKLGTKTVAGAVLVGATLMVGLGVVNNFSGGSQKAANEMALSRFGGGAYNNISGSNSASRADLERQMSATQDGYRTRFLKGKSDGTNANEAYSSDGAYEEGVRADEGFVYASNSPYGAGGNYGANGVYGANKAYGANGTYANGEVYQPFNSTYEQGEGSVGEEFPSDASAYGNRNFQAAQSAAAAAAAEGKGSSSKAGKDKGFSKGAKNNGGKVRPATQINRLAASSGGSAFGSGGSGAGYSGSGSFGNRGSMESGDNNTRALPQTNPNQTDAEAFKFGRASSMGGFNVGINGSEYKGGDSKGRGSVADLKMAVAYSGKALASRQDVGQKSLAEAAFDGSNPENLSPTIEEGATIGKVANDLLDASNIGDLPDALKQSINDLEIEVNDIAERTAEFAELQEQLNRRYWILLGGVLGFFLSIAIAKYIGGPWGLIAAAILSAGAAVFISLQLWGGDYGLFKIIGRMADERYADLITSGDISQKKFYAGAAGVAAAAIVAAGWLNDVTQVVDKTWTFLKNAGLKLVAKIESKGLSYIKGIVKLISKITKP